MTLKWSASMQHVLIQTFPWHLLMCVGMAHYSQATLRLLKVCMHYRLKQVASNELCISRSWTIVLLFTCSTWWPVSPAGNTLRIYTCTHTCVACESLQCDSVLRDEFVCTTGCNKFAGNDLCRHNTTEFPFWVFSPAVKAIGTCSWCW